MDKQITLLCNCEATMPVDGKKIGAALNVGELPVHHNLCRAGIKEFEAALLSESSIKSAPSGTDLNDISVCVGCTQEVALFTEIASDAGVPDPSFFNIRELAGWSDDGKNAGPKMAALIARSSFSQKPARAKAIHSDGLCLVIGSGQNAFEAAALLNQKLSVTLLLTDFNDLLLPASYDFPIFCGKVKQASGSFGAFDLIIDDYAAMLPSSKNQLQFTMARSDVKSSCSVLFDLTRDTPLFTRHESLDGYFKVDGANPGQVMKAIFDASDMVGDFEKPIYVEYDAEICAHSRSQKNGCSKCLDNCPAGAIVPNGDQVSFDLSICGGCGNCAAHCPTGAVSYLYPDRSDHIRAMQILSETYLNAGGSDPVLLIHDGSHGLDLISAMARYGKGLPAFVIPFEMHSTSGIGHDALIAAIGAGFSQIVILADPRNSDEYDVIVEEIKLTHTILQALGFSDERIVLDFSIDPDVFEDQLWNLPRLKNIAEKSFLPLGGKREISRTAIGVLADVAKSSIEIIPLNDSAPYGVVSVDTDACTLCLACVSACPVDALRDNPDKPELRFVETACVQCGLCQATCPEQAISLTAQLNLTPAAMQPITLNEEEPFDCIKCGTPFAAKSTIDKISKQLAGAHRMFASDENAQLLQMCDVCRIETLAASSEGDPFALAQRPVPRTSDDYIKAESEGLTIDDFLKKDA